MYKQKYIYIEHNALLNFKCHDCKGGSIGILIQCYSSKLEIKTFKFSNTYGQNQYRKFISRIFWKGST